jgi:crossover junction endodeoxyribonuclease RuvC
VRVFGIDPGSVRTGYGCIDSDGRRHRLVACGAVSPPVGTLASRLAYIHDHLAALLAECQPSCVAIENVFHAKNVRSALILGHARGVAVLASVRAGVPLMEYAPAEIKASVAGYGRADKGQMQRVVQLLLGLDTAPRPHDAADALAVAICHVHAQGPVAQAVAVAARAPRRMKSWRHVRAADLPGRRSP